MIVRRTRSRSAGTSCAVSPAVSTGSSTRHTASARRKRNEPFAIMWRVPATAIGRIGTPVSIARRKAPSLNGSSSPPFDRVPSGKIMTETRFASRSRQAASASTVLERLPRVRRMSPAMLIIHPMTGILKIVSFDSHFISHGRWLMRKMSA